MTAFPSGFSELVERVVKARARGTHIDVLSDFDGTASLYVNDPATAVAHPDFVQAFSLLAEDCRVSPGIVTGRPLSFLSEQFPCPSVDLYCSYSVEQRCDGKERIADFVQTWELRLLEARSELTELLTSCGITVCKSAQEAECIGGVTIERAPTRLVLYIRAGAMAHCGLRDRCLQAMDQLSSVSMHGSVLGSMTRKSNSWHVEFEITDPEGRSLNKTTALLDIVDRRLVQAAKHPGRFKHFVLFGGDDLNDVDLACAVKGIGGTVLAVGHDGGPHELYELADIVFDGVASYAAALYSLSLALAGQTKSFTN